MTSDILEEIAREEFTEFILLEMQFTTPFYGTSLDRDVYYESNKYTPIGIKKGELDIAAALSVDRLDIEIDNVDLRLTAALLLEDCKNKTVILYYGTMLGDQTVSCVEFFRGFLDYWEIDNNNGVCRIYIANELILWNKRTLRVAQASCPWMFKKTECSYVGEEIWCDKSYSRCEVLSNTANFGGSRFLPSTAEKQLWWGKIPKV